MKKKKNKNNKKEKTGEVLERKTEVVSQENEKPKKVAEVPAQEWDYVPITMESWFEESKIIEDEVLHRK